jgi:hypothetical protein
VKKNEQDIVTNFLNQVWNSTYQVNSTKSAALINKNGQPNREKAGHQVGSNQNSQNKLQNT